MLFMFLIPYIFWGLQVSGILRTEHSSTDGHIKLKMTKLSKLLYSAYL